MAWQIGVPLTLPDKLSLISQTNAMEEENQLLQVFL